MSEAGNGDGFGFPEAEFDTATTPPFKYKIARYQQDVLALETEVWQVGAPWTVIGGEEGESTLEVHLLVGHPHEPTLTARLILKIPFVAGLGEVAVGSPSVREA